MLLALIGRKGFQYFVRNLLFICQDTIREFLHLRQGQCDLHEYLEIYEI